MKLQSWFFLVTTTCVICLFPAVTGCGGAGLELGKGKSLEDVEPDFIDPVWYEDYDNDRAAAYKRFKRKVLQVELTVTEIEEASRGIDIQGITGLQDRYEIRCAFAAAAKPSLERVTPFRRITVKGVFDHMQETSRTYKLYLKNCALVSG